MVETINNSIEDSFIDARLLLTRICKQAMFEIIVGVLQQKQRLLFWL